MSEVKYSIRLGREDGLTRALRRWARNMGWKTLAEG